MPTLNSSTASVASVASLLSQVEAGQKWLRYRHRWWFVRGEGAARYLARMHGISRRYIVQVETVPDPLRLLARLK